MTEQAQPQPPKRRYAELPSEERQKIGAAEFDAMFRQQITEENVPPEPPPAQVTREEFQALQRRVKALLSEITGGSLL